MQQRETNIFYMIIGLLFLSAVFLLLFIYFSDNIPSFNFSKNDTEKTIFTEFDIKVVDTDNKQLKADYEIWSEGSLKQTGQVKPNVLERYTKGSNRSNYTVVAQSPDHYQHSNLCDLENGVCKVELETIGDSFIGVHQFTDKNHRATIHIFNGVINSPILCMKWSYDIDKLVFDDGNFTSVPTQFVLDFDQCLVVQTGYFEGTADFNITIDYDNDISSSNQTSYELHLIDLCPQNKNHPYRGCMEDKIVKVIN